MRLAERLQQLRRRPRCDRRLGHRLQPSPTPRQPRPRHRPRRSPTRRPTPTQSSSLTVNHQGGHYDHFLSFGSMSDALGEQLQERVCFSPDLQRQPGVFQLGLELSVSCGAGRVRSARRCVVDHPWRSARWLGGAGCVTRKCVRCTNPRDEAPPRVRLGQPRRTRRRSGSSTRRRTADGLLSLADRQHRGARSRPHCGRDRARWLRS